jgi:preprotein translocase subunit YajC
LDAGGLIILIALFALFWLFIIRPQRRRLQEQRDLHESVAVGDEIVTMGGLLGHVRGVNEDDDTLLVEIAPETNVRVARRGIAAVIAPEDGADAGRKG